MPKKIEIDEITEGCILAKTISNKYDQILIKQGVTLDIGTHIRILKMWGITEVIVYDSILDSLVSDISADNSVIEKELLEKLGWNIKNDNDKFLIDIAVMSKVKEYII